MLQREGAETEGLFLIFKTKKKEKKKKEKVPACATRRPRGSCSLTPTSDSYAEKENRERGVFRHQYFLFPRVNVTEGKERGGNGDLEIRPGNTTPRRKNAQGFDGENKKHQYFQQLLSALGSVC